MLAPVGALAVLSCIGGLLQWAPLWTPLSTWLAPVAAPIAEPTSAQEWASSGLALVLGLSGAGLAWLLYGARRLPVPRALPLLERKFYWDELYDALWYRTSDGFSRALAAVVERPLIGGSISAVTEAFGLSSRELSVAQNGLVRSYALALAGGIALLAVVFLSVR
jgi:NADH-quinone oxidoreductase subunit L